MSHVGQEMLTLSGTPDFTPFGEFMISPIHYIYITEFVSRMTMFKDLRLDLRSWLPDIDQLRGWTELIKSPRADRPKGFGSALSFPEAIMTL